MSNIFEWNTASPESQGMSGTRSHLKSAASVIMTQASTTKAR
jgi:hypothetical protein